MSQHLFYLERAAEAQASAGAATLENVRERWLQSAASWTGMAARSARSDALRAELIATKAAEREAERAAVRAAGEGPFYD